MGFSVGNIGKAAGNFVSGAGSAVGGGIWGAANQARKGIKKGATTLADIGDNVMGSVGNVGEAATKFVPSLYEGGLANAFNVAKKDPKFWMALAGMGGIAAAPYLMGAPIAEGATGMAIESPATVAAGDAMYPGILGAGGLGGAETGGIAGVAAGDAMYPGVLGAGGLDAAAANAAAASELAPAALSTTVQQATGTAGAIGAGKAAAAGGGANPWVLGGALAGKGILSYLGAKEAAQATEPYAEASEDAMARLEQYAKNPNKMYENDLGLRQLRKNALDAVTARQLQTTGGTEGGNYARQLMSESAAIDRQNLMALANLEATIMGQAAPFAQQNIAVGNPLVSTGQSVLNDVAFMTMVGALG